MHIGRTYPYHPVFYALDGYFWPNYIAWKMFLHFNGAVPGIWGTVDPTLNSATDAGVVTSDRLLVSWSKTMLRPESLDILTVEAWFDRTDAHHEKKWKMTLNRDGLNVAVAFYDGPREVEPAEPGAWVSAIDLQTGLPTFPPGITVEVASYAQGGSPFPHATGGTGGPG